jgi:hypothetical protein
MGNLMKKKLLFLALGLLLTVLGLAGPLSPTAQAASGCTSTCVTNPGCSPCCTVCCPSTHGTVCHHTGCIC